MRNFMARVTIKVPATTDGFRCATEWTDDIGHYEGGLTSSGLSLVVITFSQARETPAQAATLDETLSLKASTVEGVWFMRTSQEGENTASKAPVMAIASLSRAS